MSAKPLLWPLLQPALSVVIEIGDFAPPPAADLQPNKTTKHALKSRMDSSWQRRM
jgi:hypothetical protein